MTAINTYMLRDRVCILSDAAHYDQNGEIIEFAPKVHVVSSFTGAITSVGLLAGSQVALDVAERFGSFDEFISSSAPRVEREFKDFLTSARDFDLRQCVSSIIVAGWSEREDRPRAFSMATDAKVAADGEPIFIWYEIDGWEHSPGLSMEQAWQLHRAGAEPGVDWDADTFDPARHGLAVMQAQRRSRTSPKFWDGEPFHCVGGHCMLTEVRREGIAQTVLHEWNDEVGEPIRAEPVPDLPLIPPSFVTTRHSEWLRMYRDGMIDPDTLLPRTGKQKKREPGVDAVMPDGLSRLQRERWLKKARKGTLEII